jgi:hypothetical protein
MRAWLIHPVVVAIIVTGLNALKPVCVDDPYYLMVSAHLSVNFTQPYPDLVHWSGKQQPGMDVLCPPALPYWLAMGRLLLGESEHRLKLWLFPIVVMLTLSLRSLQRAWQLDDRLVPLVAYGGGCLPMINVMLDVPAMACGLAAFALIVQGGLSRAALAGLMLAVGFQTKYTMMTMPVIVGLYCLLQRKWLGLIVSMAVAGALVNGWEWYVVWKQGSSHYWHHLKDHSGKVNFPDKMNMILSHLRHAGFLLIGPMIVVLQSQWPSGRHAWVAAAIGIITCLGVTFLPAPWGMRFARVGFHALAVIFVIAFLVVAFRLWRSGDRFNRFLVAWMAIEFAAMVALSPFVAGRRVVPIGFSFAIAACRFSRSAGCEPSGQGLHGGFTPTSPTRRSRLWLVGPLLGIALFTLDAWDARAEMVVARQLADAFRGERLVEGIAYLGHWGFEHHLTHAPTFRGDGKLGPALPAEPGRLVKGMASGLFSEGRMLVVPLSELRPGHRFGLEKLDLTHFREVGRFEADDYIPGSTIPTLYGGGYPIATKPTPRFGVVLLRCNQSHNLQAKP